MGDMNGVLDKLIVNAKNSNTRNVAQPSQVPNINTPKNIVNDGKTCLECGNPKGGITCERLKIVDREHRKWMIKMGIIKPDLSNPKNWEGKK